MLLCSHLSHAGMVEPLIHPHAVFADARSARAPHVRTLAYARLAGRDEEGALLFASLDRRPAAGDKRVNEFLGSPIN